MTKAGYQGLYDWPRTGNEDIHESFGALLPVGASGHVSDADKSSQEINRVEVSPYVAALDSALHQGTSRFVDWGV